MNHICLDCHQIFEKAEKKQFPDHTGQIDLIIDVCPACISTHIIHTSDKYLLIMDQVEYKHLLLADQYFKNGVKENLLKTNDPTIAEYYRGLLMLSDLIVKNISKL